MQAVVKPAQLHTDPFCAFLGFNSLLSSCEKEGQWQLAVHYLHTMRQAALHPDLRTATVPWSVHGSSRSSGGRGITPEPWWTPENEHHRSVLDREICQVGL